MPYKKRYRRFRHRARRGYRTFKPQHLLRWGPMSRSKIQRSARAAAAVAAVHSRRPSTGSWGDTIRHGVKRARAMATEGIRIYNDIRRHRAWLDSLAGIPANEMFDDQLMLQ